MIFTIFDSKLWNFTSIFQCQDISKNIQFKFSLLNQLHMGWNTTYSEKKEPSEQHNIFKMDIDGQIQMLISCDLFFAGPGNKKFQGPVHFFLIAKDVRQPKITQGYKMSSISWIKSLVFLFEKITNNFNDTTDIT